MYWEALQVKLLKTPCLPRAAGKVFNSSIRRPFATAWDWCPRPNPSISVPPRNPRQRSRSTNRPRPVAWQPATQVPRGVCNLRPTTQHDPITSQLAWRLAFERPHRSGGYRQPRTAGTWAVAVESGCAPNPGRVSRLPSRACRGLKQSPTSPPTAR